MSQRTCSIEGCTGPVRGRGYCNKHYLRWKNNGDPLISRRPLQEPVCIHEGCGKPSHHRSLCLSHYREWQKTQRGPCSVDGCDEPWHSNGLCATHYTRWRRHGTTDAPKEAGRTCSIGGCEGRVVARELCGKHYRRWQKYGTTELPPRPARRKQCSEDGCELMASRRNGMCDYHYRLAVDARKPPCSVSGCEEPSHSKGLCRLHYDRWRRYRTTDLPPPKPKHIPPPCAIEGCDRRARCRGWCDLHYERWRRHGDPMMVTIRRRKPRMQVADVDVEAKVCARCKRRLPLSGFYRRKATPDGLMYRCKDCCRDAYNERYANDPGFREQRKRHDRMFYEAQQAEEEQRRSRGLQKYGLTIEEFDALAAVQGGKCAICGTAPRPDSRKRRLAVDHDHATGAVRGLLCGSCNSALGLFKDDIKVLREAIAYLKRTGSVKPAGNVRQLRPRPELAPAAGETLW